MNRKVPNIFDYKAAIFDLDGTLIDSMGMWGEIDIEYLERFGIEVPENLQRELEGLRFSEVAEYFRIPSRKSGRLGSIWPNINTNMTVR